MFPHGGGVNKSSLCDNAVISVVIPAYNEETSISKCCYVCTNSKLEI